MGAERTSWRKVSLAEWLRFVWRAVVGALARGDRPEGLDEPSPVSIEPVAESGDGPDTGRPSGERGGA